MTTASALVSPPATVNRVPNEASGEVPVGFPYNYADLCRAASEQFGMTRSRTLEIAVSLYSRGLISYPKGEGREICSARFAEASLIVRGYNQGAGSRKYDPDYRGPCWVDKISGAHDAIMPTSAAAASIFGVRMSEDENQIYGLIHARFLGLFIRPESE